MTLFRLPPNKTHLRRFALLGCYALVASIGCNRPTGPGTTTVQARNSYHEVNLNSPVPASQVLAQGRIQPARGLIKVGAIPGDRVEKILVRPGQPIKKGDPLIVLQSQNLRTLELQAATIRVEEAKALRQAKQQEADLAIEAATLKLDMAIQSNTQAMEQQRLAKKNDGPLVSIRSQISQLEQLRNTKLTRAAIGTIELESKKNELTKATLLNEQSLLAAEQAVKFSELQLSHSQKSLNAAMKARELVDSATPVASLESQLELIKIQLEQSKVLAGFDGVVVSLNVEEGERTTVLPMMELADLSSMICIAEVHESDASRIAVDDHAELQSSALGRKLKGRVLRIDRVVGAAQMRSPNPMARSDFRSIPVWIAIDQDDTSAAAERLQLQVDVSISTTR